MDVRAVTCMDVPADAACMDVLTDESMHKDGRAHRRMYRCARKDVLMDACVDVRTDVCTDMHTDPHMDVPADA